MPSDGDESIGKLFTTIRDCGVEIYLNGNKISDFNQSQLEGLFFADKGHKTKNNEHCSNISIILQALFLYKKNIDDGTHIQLLQYFSRLSEENEACLEKDDQYQLLKNQIRYYDSHNHPTVFNNPKVNCNAVHSSDYQIDLSAKPDGVHYLFPSFIEIKGKGAKHLECLTQGIKRILASISSYGLFGKHFVFVVEKYFSFIIFCNLQSFGSPIIQIFLVSLEDLCSLLLILNANIENNPAYYTHSHSNSVFKIFNSLNEKLFNGDMSITKSQITKVAESSSIVYKILFNDNKTVDSMKNTSIIIKINENIDRFNMEKESTKRMDEYYRLQKKEYFVIGYCESDSDIILLNRSNHYQNQNIVDLNQIGLNGSQDQMNRDYFEITNSLSNISLKKTNNDVIANTDNDNDESLLLGWFNGNYNFKSSPPCGIIIMEEGQSLTEFSSEIYCDLLESLSELHEMRVLHRDLRSCNFLHFPQLNRYFIIDYDLSVTLPLGQFSTPMTIRKSSGQGQRVPMKYRNLLKNNYCINVDWSFDDDVIMLCEYASSKGSEITYDS